MLRSIRLSNYKCAKNGVLTVAHYINQHISERDVREHVESITGILYNEQAAIIVMFLCHLSMDDFILKNILNTASKIFSNYDECNLKDDILFLGNIYDKDILPELPDSSDQRRNRQEMLRAQDEAQNKLDSNNEVVYPTIEGSLEKDESFAASQVNASFKTIQLLGQIARNFQGKMLAEKKEIIAKSCFSLTLRTISSFFEFVQAEKKDILKTIEEKINEEKPDLAQSQVKLQTQKQVFALSEFMVLAIIKHCSDSIGLRDLTPTFDEIFKEKISLPHSILALSIKLDNSSDFPIEEVEDLYNPRELNFFSQVLIRHLVWFNLYLYPVDYQIRQRMKKIIEIDGTEKIFIKTEQKLLPAKSATRGKKKKKLSRKERRKRKQGR